MSSRLVWSAANWQMQGWGTCVCVCICSSILSLIWLNVCLFLGANPLFLSYWLQMHYWLGYLLHVELPFSFCINNAGKRCVLEEGRCSEMIDGRLFDFNALSLGCSLAAPGLVLVFSRSSCWRWKSPYPSPPPSSLTHMRNDKWIVVTPSTAIILQAFQSVHIDCAAIMVALAFFFFTIHVCWSVAPACDSPFHINAQKCEKRSARYYGVFVCRGTLQLLCGGGDMVEAILMQCPPLPDSAPILLFPFRCDSCWDWLLGDHIPGTKSPAGVDRSVRYHIL